ncbi:MAG TPA: PAS domain-containing protein [Fibrobacteria bacterium]|nr:PAS domain-containing protein [Fibrobacteria bacterium]
MQKSRLSSDEYATLVEQSPILIWRADLSMGCDYFNERWLAFTGRTMEQEFGNGWAEGVHPDDFDRCLQIYTTHFARRESFEMEYRLRRADGEYRWLLDRGSPFHGPDGAFLGFIGSCVDVTDRIAAQEELRRMHEKELDELRGVIPICSYCRKVRDDRNYWQQLDAFLAKHSKTEFSHGICPECKDRLLAD